MFNRRDFLRSSAIVSLAPTLPTFLQSLANANQSARETEGRILVVIQLDGGNDGINTVVPFRDEGYAKHRRELRLPETDLIKVADDFSLHPRLRRVADLFEDSKLSIVHGVGYPNPNRSHFESMAIWNAGSTDKEQIEIGQGWIGSAMGEGGRSRDSQAIHVGDETLPVALRGRRCTAASISNPAELQSSLEKLGLAAKTSSESLKTANGSSDSLDAFLSRSVSDAFASAKELSTATKDNSTARYPDSKLGGRLKLVGQLIKSNTNARVYYTQQSGYDTHAGQLPTHASLLNQLSSALKAFNDDMHDAGMQDEVLVMVFSEFGRRVDENQSAGTDHGTAGPIFLAGTKLQQRSYGSIPSLTDLENGDPKFQLDFRHIYASIIKDWLELKSPSFLESYGLREMFV